MKKTNKTIGIFIIGMATTLLIAIPFLVLGYDVSFSIWTLNEFSSMQLFGDEIFLCLLFIGTAITSIFALQDHKLSKAIVYPISIGLIIGTLLGVLFPMNKSSYPYINEQILFIVLTLGFSISLISIGRYFLKK